MSLRLHIGLTFAVLSASMSHAAPQLDLRNGANLNRKETSIMATQILEQKTRRLKYEPIKSGQVFGKLTALEDAFLGKDLRHHVKCRCSCELKTIKVFLAKNVHRGLSRSCGKCREKRRHDLSGQRFGRLVAVKWIARCVHGGSLWECKCDCGETSIVRNIYLTSGHTRSCGCLVPEAFRENFTIHGMSKTSPHSTWRGMLGRCYRKTCPSFKYYGAMGVGICDRWRFGEDGMNGFQCFFKDMGFKPSPKHSIDRFPDNNGDYRPGNCRWATPKQQRDNQRPRKK